MLKINNIIIDQALVSGSRFLLTLFIARELGMNDYGTYIILWSFVLLLSSVQIPIIINPLVSIGSQTKNLAQKTFFTSFLVYQIIFSIFSSIIFFIIYLIDFNYFHTFQSDTFIYLSLYGVTYNFYEFIRKYLFTIFEDTKVLIVDFMIYIALLIGVFLLAINELFSLTTFFFLSFFIYIIALLNVMKFYRFENIQVKTLCAYWKTNITYALPMFQSSLMQFISGHFFIYISAFLLGTYSAGVIGILRNLFAPLIVLFMMIDNIVPRQATQNYELGIFKLKSYISKILLHWGSIIILILLILSIFSSNIIIILYGNEYEIYSEYLLWFIFSHILMFLTRVYSIYMRTINSMDTFKYQGFYSLVFTLVFTYPSIHFFGLDGAFLIMLSQQVIIFFILVKDSKYYV